MKKTIQFLIALSIILEGSAAFAGTPETAAKADKTAANIPIVSPIRGGQQIIGIIVYDSENGPIEGATVTAPCTGLPPTITDVNGYAQFKLPGSCNCNEKPAHISTPAGCDMNTTIVCGTGNEATCTNQ